MKRKEFEDKMSRIEGTLEDAFIMIQQLENSAGGRLVPNNLWLRGEKMILSKMVMQLRDMYDS